MAACKESPESEEKASVFWNQERTKTLIKLRREHDGIFHGKKGCAKKGWTFIAKKMGFFPHEKHYKTVQKKWQNMIAKYKKLKKKSAGQHKGDGEGPVDGWPFYWVMDEMMMKLKRRIQPIVPFIIDRPESPADPSSSTLTSPIPSFAEESAGPGPSISATSSPSPTSDLSAPRSSARDYSACFSGHEEADFDTGVANVFTVTCPDHHKILVNGLWNAFTNKYLTDFAVDWNGQTARAHQLILDIFLPSDKLELSIPEGKIGDLNLLLEFMYSGKVDVRRDQMQDTLGVARMLDFQLMVDALEAAAEQCQSAGSNRQARGQKRPNAYSLPPQGDRGTAGLTPAKKKRVISAPVEVDGNASDIIIEVDIPYDSDTDGSEGAAAVETVVSAKPTKSKTRRRPDSNLVVPEIENSGDGDQKNDVRSTIKTSSSPPPVKYQLRNSSAHSKKTNQECPKINRLSSTTLFRCQTCGTPFLDKATLARHCQLKHQDQRDLVYQCPHCEYKNRSKEYCEIHMRRRHGDADGELLRCDKCSMAFLNREKYENHLNNHRPYQCQHCTFVTEKKWSYENHLFREHGLSVTGKPRHPHQCTQCSYQGKNAAVLRYHVAARHSIEKPYKCTVAGCSYAAFSKKAAKLHVKFTHLDDKNFMCEFCSTRMRSAGALAIHRRSHTGEKPFQCTICERCFTSRDILKKHMVLHTNPDDKPFLCHLCSFACNRRDNLRTHLKGKHKHEIGIDELGAM